MRNNQVERVLIVYDRDERFRGLRVGRNARRAVELNAPSTS
jgi:hypothetical protein